MFASVKGISTTSRRRLAGVALALALGCSAAGCGSSIDVSSPAHASVTSATSSCAATVVDTVAHVLTRVYHEGVFSERTASAEHLIDASAPLRAAVESGSPAATRAAARELLRTGHMTDLHVVAGARTLANVGGSALTPLHGTITSAGGAPIATYTTSVWSDEGFIAEASGVAQGFIDLRAGERSVAGSIELPPGALPGEGTITYRHAVYEYTSFEGVAYPAGAIRVFVLEPVSSTASLCGATAQATVVNTLKRIATLIYEGERGPATGPQIRRIESYTPLLEAVARREPAATETAIKTILHRHLVRLRVLAPGGQLLADVGGPYVLAPVTAPVIFHGRRIGSMVLSIQDDEGFKRLAERLEGLPVLMYMHPPGAAKPELVKNSLGPSPGTVPASGAYTYRGKQFTVFTIHAEAFPSGPLTIRVLVPVAYPLTLSAG